MPPLGVALLYLAVVGSALAFVLLYWLIKCVDVTKTQLIPLASTPVASVLGALVLGGRLTPPLSHPLRPRHSAARVPASGPESDNDNMTEKQTEKAFQDFYTEETQYCYGCGPRNEQGLHIRSFWDGEETVARFDPRPYHVAVPGFVYGGLVASLIDCHGTGSAAAFAYRDEGRELGSEPSLRFVTGSLHVDYLKPTPLGVTLTLRGRKKSVRGRVVTVTISLYAEGVECARGEVVAVRIPDNWLESLKAGRPGA